MQNFKYMCGDCTTVRRRKAAGWLAFPNQKKKVLRVL